MSNGDGRGREKTKLFMQVGSDGPACVMLRSSILRINTTKLGIPFVLLENEAQSLQ